MKKRFFSLFLVLTMAMTLLPVQAFAAERIPLGPTAPSTQKRPERTILRGRQVQDQPAQQETVQQPAQVTPQSAPATVQSTPAPQAADMTISNLDEWNAFVEAIKTDSSINANLANDISLLNASHAPIEGYTGILNGNGHTITLASGTVFGTLTGKVRQLFVSSGAALCKNISGGSITDCAVFGGGQVVAEAQSSSVILGVTRSYYLNGNQGAVYDASGKRTEIKDPTKFSSGEVCWMLNGETSENVTWYQTLVTGGTSVNDPRPVLDSSRGTVYYGYPEDSSCAVNRSYSNDPRVADAATHPGFNASGVCTTQGCNKKLTLTVPIETTGETTWAYDNTSTEKTTLEVKATHDCEVPDAEVTYLWSNGATTASIDIPHNTSVGTTTYTCDVTYGGYTVKTEAVTITVTKTGSTVEVAPKDPSTLPDTDPKIPDPNDTSTDPEPLDPDDVENPPEYSYECIFGDKAKITVTVAAQKNTASARMAPRYAAPETNQVAVFHGANQVSEPATVANNTANLTIDTFDAGLAPRKSSYMLEVKYVGNDNMAPSAATVALAVKFLDSAPDATIDGTKGDNDWYRSTVKLLTPTDYKISESVENWAEALEIADNSTGETGKEYTYYLKNAKGQIAQKTVTLKIDTVRPNVTAEMTERLDNSAKITVTGYADGGSPIVKYSLKKQGDATATEQATGEFTISGLQPDEERVYIATVTDEAGNVSEERTVTVYKVSKSLNDAEITFDENFDYTYDGAAKEPAVTVSIAGAEVPSREYDVTYTNNINAGSATVTITGKNTYSGTKTDDFTIDRKPVTADVAVTDKTYDGTNKATVTVTVNDSDLETQGTTKDVVTITGVTGTFASANAGTQDVTIDSTNMTVSNSNYDVTVPETIKGTISPLVLTKFEIPGANIEKTYDGLPVPMSAVTVEPELAKKALETAWTKKGSSDALSGDPTNVGDYMLTVSLKNPDNYTYPNNVKSLTKQVTIKKAVTTPKTDSKILIRNGFDNETVYFNFDTLFPKPESPCVFGNPTYTVDKTDLAAGYRDITDVKTTGQQLSVHVNSTNQDTEGEVGTIKVTMTSDNYNPATAIIHVSATSKEIVQISGVSISGGSKTYDGKPVELVWNPKATAGNDEVILSPDDFKRVFSDGTKEFTDPPKNAGDYTLTVTVDTKSASGLLEIPFKISKREVEWDTSGLTAVKKYDGTIAPPAVTGELKLKAATEGKGFLEGDDVRLVVGELLVAKNFTHAGAHAEDLPLEKVWSLEGADAGNYRFPSAVPAVRAEITSDGTSSGNDPDITVSEKDPSGKALKIMLTSGIPESAITDDLKDKGFDTPAKIKAELEKSLTSTQKTNSVLYDLKLMVQDGSGWKEATSSNFPAGGITVTLPYPSGTNKNYKFTVVHMFSTTANSKTAGQTETLSGSAITNLANDIRFKLNGLSPVLVTWTKSSSSNNNNNTDKDDKDDKDDEETYRVKIADLSHGKITARPTRAEEGETVTLTIKPDSGYQLSSLTVTDRRGKDVKVKEKSNGKYTFKMPARWVEVDATFTPTSTYVPSYPTTNYYPTIQWNANTTSCTGGASCPSRAFPDLDSAMWYHGSTDFVIQRGLMAGQSDGRFAPNTPLTRAMLVQILYTHAGRPVPSSSASFRDVDRGAWYENAVNWAAEQGVASGIGNNAFAPKSPVTREQLAVMLYNYASRRGISLQATQSRSSFSDSARISSWASSAVTVMQQAGIVSGKQGYIFDPKGQASRAETAQMLWKLLN